MSEKWRTTVRCMFYRRTNGPDGYDYEAIDIRTPDGPGLFVLPDPPAVGDLVNLPGVDETFRVIERAWGYSAWGSQDWPLADPTPKVGPLLTLIVEHAMGPFRDVTDVYSHG